MSALLAVGLIPFMMLGTYPSISTKDVMEREAKLKLVCVRDGGGEAAIDTYIDGVNCAISWHH